MNKLLLVLLLQSSLTFADCTNYSYYTGVQETVNGVGCGIQNDATGQGTVMPTTPQRVDTIVQVECDGQPEFDNQPVVLIQDDGSSFVIFRFSGKLLFTKTRCSYKELPYKALS